VPKHAALTAALPLIPLTGVSRPAGDRLLRHRGFAKLYAPSSVA
jgi:hypothetical protein